MAMTKNATEMKMKAVSPIRMFPGQVVQLFESVKQGVTLRPLGREIY
jgi:hypothetical protein